MDKKQVCRMMLLVLVLMCLLSGLIFDKKRAIANTTFSKDNVTIENTEELPEEVQLLMKQYMEALERELNYMQIAWGVLLLAFVLFGYIYVQLAAKERRKS